MNNLEKRFKIIALAILGSGRFDCLGDKLEIVASAIDRNSEVAEKMVGFLEDSVLRLSEVEVN